MGALRLHSGHAEERADDLDSAKPYAKPNLRTGQLASVSRIITRSEKEQRRAAFCEALRQRGAAAEVMRAWGVTETVVRKVKKGHATLTDERLLALPPSIRAAIERSLAAPVQLRLEGL
jgi:hypothetical protein